MPDIVPIAVGACKCLLGSPCTGRSRLVGGREQGEPSQQGALPGADRGAGVQRAAVNCSQSVTRRVPKKPQQPTPRAPLGLPGWGLRAAEPAGGSVQPGPKAE